jgi:hypothetical protein
LRLICYPTSGAPPKIVAAPINRAWMDRTPNNFAYRCLPLNIANAHGWLILNDLPFTAYWNGEPGVNAVSIRPCGVGGALLARSHFGAGILTFGVNALFRTEPGYDLMVTGPLNQLKDATQPLSGLVETDWAPFTFTMNWKFTRKDRQIAFERDEPFCMIFPMKRGMIEEFEPEIRPMDSDNEVLDAYRAFARSRVKFNEDLQIPKSEARNQKWQKDYFVGTTNMAAAPPDHRTKIKLREFKLIS